MSLINISKAMSYILRHGALKLGLNMDSEGWVEIDELLRVKDMQKLKVDYQKLDTVVKTNNKQRFAVKIQGGKKYIRANQGHSKEFSEILDESKLLKPILVPIKCIHGTDKVGWDKIKIDGLRPMGRTHIHLAKDYPHGNVISGARKSSEVFIEVDMKKAIEGGIKFFESDNGVILCSENIPAKYFKKVLCDSKEILLDDPL